jgi:hypothetical protein
LQCNYTLSRCDNARPGTEHCGEADSQEKTVLVSGDTGGEQARSHKPVPSTKFFIVDHEHELPPSLLYIQFEIAIRFLAL